MKLIDRLSKNELSDLISKCWMTHDGMWFYNSFLEFGIETANKLNKSAIRSLASIEIKHIKKALGIKDIRIDTYEEFKGFFSSISDILVPDFMNVILSFPRENVVHWEFNDKRCFAYNGIKLLGVNDNYECGPIYRIKCWLMALGINFEISPEIEKCISPHDGKCSGDFILLF